MTRRNVGNNYQLSEIPFFPNMENLKSYGKQGSVSIIRVSLKTDSPTKCWPDPITDIIISLIRNQFQRLIGSPIKDGSSENVYKFALKMVLYRTL